MCVGTLVSEAERLRCLSRRNGWIRGSLLLRLGRMTVKEQHLRGLCNNRLYGFLDNLKERWNATHKAFKWAGGDEGKVEFNWEGKKVCSVFDRTFWKDFINVNIKVSISIPKKKLLKQCCGKIHKHYIESFFFFFFFRKNQHKTD